MILAQLNEVAVVSVIHSDVFAKKSEKIIRGHTHITVTSSLKTCNNCQNLAITYILGHILLGFRPLSTDFM